MKTIVVRIVVFLLTAGALSPAHTPAVPMDAEIMRAIVLTHILPAIYWPDSLLAKQNKDITICVIGKNSSKYATALRKETASLKIKGLPVKILTLPAPNSVDDYKSVYFRDALNSCLILYFTRDMQEHFDEVSRNMQQKSSVLTVGEEASFCQDNGMVCLGIRNKRLNLVINTERTRQSGLKIGANVLQHAVIIE